MNSVYSQTQIFLTDLMIKWNIRAIFFMLFHTKLTFWILKQVLICS